MEGIICNTSLSKTEIGKLKVGQKLLLHTREGYCSLLAEVHVFGCLGIVGCEVTIDRIVDPCTESKSKTGDTIWADYHNLAILN